MIRNTACLLVATLGVSLGALAVDPTPKGPAKKASTQPPAKSPAKQTAKQSVKQASRQTAGKQTTKQATKQAAAAGKQLPRKQVTGARTAAKQVPTKQAATRTTTTTTARTTATTGVTKSGSRTTAGKRQATTTASRRRRPAVPSWRASQQQPTLDRVREIQGALIKRGYMQGEADGNWGASTSDALKRFQQDQNITADGKLSSLSLIALGLGPKRTTAAAVKPPSSQRAIPGEPQSGNPPAAADPASAGGQLRPKELQ